jgi:hypothetical protein
MNAIFLSYVYHVFICTAIVFVLDCHMGYPEFFLQHFIDGIPYEFGFTDPDIGFQIDMAFEMDILVA